MAAEKLRIVSLRSPRYPRIHVRPTPRFETQLTASLAAHKIAQILCDLDREQNGYPWSAVGDVNPEARSRYYRHAEACLRRIDPNAMKAAAFEAAQALADYDAGRDNPHPPLKDLSVDDQTRQILRSQFVITAYERTLQNGAA